MCSKVVVGYNFNSYLAPGVDNPLISVAKSRMILGCHSRKSEQECCCCFWRHHGQKKKSWGETRIADNTSYDNSESFFVFVTQYNVLKTYFITRNRLKTAISIEITQSAKQSGRKSSETSNEFEQISSD